jgi:hypothetical protein
MGNRDNNNSDILLKFENEQARIKWVDWKWAYVYIYVNETLTINKPRLNNWTEYEVLIGRGFQKGTCLLSLTPIPLAVELVRSYVG